MQKYHRRWYNNFCEEYNETADINTDNGIKKIRSKVKLWPIDERRAECIELKVETLAYLVRRDDADDEATAAGANFAKDYVVDYQYLDDLLAMLRRYFHRQCAYR